LVFAFEAEMAVTDLLPSLPLGPHPFIAEKRKKRIEPKRRRN
jgi:hypothetical protein